MASLRMLMAYIIKFFKYSILFSALAVLLRQQSPISGCSAPFPAAGQPSDAASLDPK
jgi:hypothetical protein